MLKFSQFTKFSVFNQYVKSTAVHYQCIISFDMLGLSILMKIRFYFMDTKSRNQSIIQRLANFDTHTHKSAISF